MVREYSGTVFHLRVICRFVGKRFHEFRHAIYTSKFSFSRIRKIKQMLRCRTVKMCFKTKVFKPSSACGKNTQITEVPGHYLEVT